MDMGDFSFSCLPVLHLSLFLKSDSRMRRTGMGEGSADRRGTALDVACYIRTMTKLLDHSVEAARGLPPTAQDDIARIVLRLAGKDDAPPAALSRDGRAAIAKSKAAAARSEFASDEQMRAVWEARNPSGTT
jgi:hypothetical protein